MSPLTWGLREVLQYAEVLLNKDDVDAKADALIDFIQERVLDQRVHRSACSGSKHYRVRVVRRSRGVVQDVLRGHGEEEQRELAHAPRGHDPQSAQPALEHLDCAARGS